MNNALIRLNNYWDGIQTRGHSVSCRPVLCDDPCPRDYENIHLLLNGAQYKLNEQPQLISEQKDFLNHCDRDANIFCSSESVCQGRTARCAGLGRAKSWRTFSCGLKVVSPLHRRVPTGSDIIGPLPSPTVDLFASQMLRFRQKTL